MNLPEPDQDFLRDLIKVSRQQTHHVRWVDRDGSARVTTLSQKDVARVAALAGQLGVGKEALLQAAAHLPAKQRPKPTGVDGTEAVPPV